MVNDRQSPDFATFAAPAGHRAVEWLISDQPVPYPEAIAAMEARVATIAADEAPERVWLLEHPALYTSGTSGRATDLLDPRFPVFASGRGGQLTYHGPGQRVAYVMLDLRERGGDVRAFIAGLERWIILALARLGVDARAHAGRVGVWVCGKKIAAIGVRLRHWVSFHGVSLNVDPDLEHYAGIVPCGLADYGVTSLRELGREAVMADSDAALEAAFGQVFGAVTNGLPPLHAEGGNRSAATRRVGRLGQGAPAL
ncbi:MAG: lipoyl(octanoyl) transferase LipB [Gemmatimonadales bacterium]